MFFNISFYPLSTHVNIFLSSCQYRSKPIFFNPLISIASNPSSIHLNLFLFLRQSKFMSTFFNLPFSILFYPLSSDVNIFLSSCQYSRCLSLPVTNFKLTFYLSLSLLTTKEDQSTTKIFYILFL